MKSITPYVLLALLIGALGAVVATGAAFERRLASAQTHLAIANLPAAEREYAAAWDEISTSRWLSWVLASVQDEIVARRAAIQYWRGDYASLVGGYARATDPRFSGNIDLRLVVANAAYRAGQRQGASIGEMLNGLDQAIALYAQLLQDAGGRVDVAFNYEFLVGLRESLSEGEDWAPRGFEDPLGQEGSQPLDSERELEDVEIFVPLNHDERDMIDEPTMGGDPPIRRRG